MQRYAELPENIFVATLLYRGSFTNRRKHLCENDSLQSPTRFVCGGVYEYADSARATGSRIMDKLKMRPLPPVLLLLLLLLLLELLNSRSRCGVCPMQPTTRSHMRAFGFGGCPVAGQEPCGMPG